MAEIEPTKITQSDRGIPVLAELPNDLNDEAAIIRVADELFDRITKSDAAPELPEVGSGDPSSEPFAG